MAGIRKKTWTTQNGIKSCYEITYYINGKLVRKSGFKTKIDAQMAIPNITRSFSKNITVLDLINIYLNEHCICQCKETTLELYKGYKGNFKKIHQSQAKKINGRDINKLIIDWKNENMKNKSINNLLGFLTACYNYAIENRLITENPVTRKHRQPKKHEKIQFLNEDEMYLFKQAIKDFPKDKRLALLLDLHTGLRIGELLALEWSDIDFNNKTLNVNKQYYKRKLTTPKTIESVRKIDLDDIILQELWEYKKGLKVLHKLIFCGETGYYWDRGKFIDNYFKKAMKQIGHASFSFHSLRHTHAAFLLSNEVNIKYVQERLGHTDAKTTLNTYDHVLPKTKSKVGKLFANLEQYEQNMSNFNMGKAENL